LLFLFFFFLFKDFVVISYAKPHQATLAHEKKPRGLKGLLHILSVAMIPTKMS